MLFLLASLFFTEPAPLDMPRAEAFLVQENDTLRLEDRYDKLDLWTSQTVIGRWTDDQGRQFVLAELAYKPPTVEVHASLTREGYAAERIPMRRIRAAEKYPPPFRRAVALLAPCALTEDEPRHSRQTPHGYRTVDYWQHPTNYTAVACTIRLEKSEKWYFAFWQLAEGDDYAERMQAFEDQFLRREFRAFLSSQLSTLNSQPSHFGRLSFCPTRRLSFFRLFISLILLTVTPNASAMIVRLSPAWTTYS